MDSEKLQEYADEFVQLEQEIFNNEFANLVKTDDIGTDLARISVLCMAIYIKLRATEEGAVNGG